jgi:2,3-bisphosphoglycerate-dependent phosphoglycerate mutase
MGEGIRLRWPKRVTVVRHGNSEQNAILDLLEPNLEEILRMQKIRDADIALTPLGHWQANQTGIYLRNQEPFDICYSSPYLRTKQTAEGIIKGLEYPLRIFEDDRLREKEFGRLHGLTTDEIQAKYPEEFEDRKRDGKYWYKLLRGENYPDVGFRLHSFLGTLNRDWAGKNVLIVTHQVPYKMFRKLFEHLTEAQVLALEDTPNCGMATYNLDTSKHADGRLKLAGFNEVGYDITKYAA